MISDKKFLEILAGTMCGLALGGTFFGPIGGLVGGVLGGIFGVKIALMFGWDE